MIEKNDKGGKDRRDFLKLASLGTIVSGATIVAASSAQAEEIENDTGRGYRETAHVKTYYDLAKF